VSLQESEVGRSEDPKLERLSLPRSSL
jgi:hypothetical protein